tara:strand:+ start:211 stop:564 length:354 start_codon:yes stop_codon:yes gene_type:complete
MLYRKYTKPGESLQKSKRKNKPIEKKGEKLNEIDKLIDNTIASPNNTVYTMDRQFMKYQENNRGSSKKEAIMNKMNERDMVVQRGCNPFLSQNNYINDLMNQEKYIRQNNNLNTTRE